MIDIHPPDRHDPFKPHNLLNPHNHLNSRCKEELPS